MESHMLVLHLAPIAVSIITAVYVYGRLTERVATNSKELERLDSVDREQWTHINNHEQRISTIEGRLE